MAVRDRHGRVARSQAEEIGNRMRAVVERACIDLVLEINRELRRRAPYGTPVDTGHARANWVASIGEPHLEEVQGEAAGQAGAAKVLTFKLGMGALYVTNNVPYIHALNYGHSDQAPALFVEAAVDRAYAKVQARYEGTIDLGRAQFQSIVGAAGAENLADAFSPFGDFEPAGAF